jgi:tetratricopeptide (TPR) repeat protein
MSLPNDITKLNIMNRFYFTLIILFLIITEGIGQQPVKRSDADSLECYKNWSLYQLALQKKMPDYSIGPWREMYRMCPDISVQQYIDGAKLYTHYIDKEKDASKREALIDTLLSIYDQRIRYFGNHPKYPEGYVWGRKGLEVVKYRRDQIAGLLLAKECFDSSWSLMGEKTEPVVALNRLQVAKGLFEHGRMPFNELIDNFLAFDQVLDLRLEDTEDESYANYQKIADAGHAVMKTCKIESCESLASTLQEAQKQHTNNPQALQRLVNLLDLLDCRDHPLYTNLLKNVFEFAPSEKSAYQLARLLVRKENFENSVTYYKKAIELSANNDAKATYYYELAAIVSNYNSDKSLARQYANEAIQLRPTWGKPYLLIGNVYANSVKSISTDEFEQKAAYWAALEKFKEAARVDPEVAEEANKQIAIYSKYVPDKESLFFHGIKEGDTYLVGGWINERCVVKGR